MSIDTVLNEVYDKAFNKGMHHERHHGEAVKLLRGILHPQNPDTYADAIVQGHQFLASLDAGEKEG